MPPLPAHPAQIVWQESINPNAERNLLQMTRLVFRVPLAHTQASKAPSQSSHAQAAALANILARVLSSACHAVRAISPIQGRQGALLVPMASFRVCQALLSAPLAELGNIQDQKRRRAALHVRTAPQASTPRFKVQFLPTIAPTAPKEHIPIQVQTDASAVRLGSI